MAQIRIRIIFEGHFIRIFKYSNIRAHHWLQAKLNPSIEFILSIFQHLIYVLCQKAYIFHNQVHIFQYLFIQVLLSSDLIVFCFMILTLILWELPKEHIPYSSWCSFICGILSSTWSSRVLNTGQSQRLPVHKDKKNTAFIRSLFLCVKCFSFFLLGHSLKLKLAEGVLP